jgi:hypothetical protein
MGHPSTRRTPTVRLCLAIARDRARGVGGKPWGRRGSTAMIEVEAIVEAQSTWRAAARAGGDAAAAAASRSLIGLRKAATTVLENLTELDYPAVPGIISPEPGLESRIQCLETVVGGAVPPILVSFWRLVGGLSFVDVNRYTHVDFWRARGITGPDGYCDAIYVDPCSTAWVEFAMQDFSDFIEDSGLSLPARPYLLSLAPDGYHKDNISGGAPYSLEIGGDWLAPWQNFSWSGARQPASAPAGPCDLLGYLRTSVLECAGFPALLGVPLFEPLRERLLRSVEVF